MRWMLLVLLLLSVPAMGSSVSPEDIKGMIGTPIKNYLHTGNSRNTVSYSTVRKISGNLSETRYTKRMDCGYFVTVWLSKFAKRDMAVGWMLLEWNGNGHYMGFYVDHDRQLNLYEPQTNRAYKINEVDKVYYFYYP